jgi:uncharacterized protein (DUF305 family)
MNKQTISWGLGGLLIGVVLGFVITPQWNRMVGGYGGGVMGRDMMMGNNNSIDTHFIEQMIPHHEDVIVMVDIALKKAEHQEIKSLAQDINRTQSEEIQQMKNWYQEWFGTPVPLSTHDGHGMMQMGMMGNDTDLGRLENSKPFDKAFIEEMIPHHQMAVMMAQMLERTTNRPEMKQLAKNIIEAQTREINSMRGWYQQWYGR